MLFWTGGAKDRVSESEDHKEDLQRRVMLGALVQLTTSLPAKLVGIGLTLLAARVLTPQLYGEYGLAVTIYGVSDLLTNPGVFTYFVRTPSASRDALDSSFVVGVIRGLILWILFWFLSPWIASLFDGGEQVTILLQMLSSVFLIVSLKNPYVVQLYHDLDYQRMALLESLGGFLGNVIGLVLLWWTESPAALVMGSLIAHSVGSVLSWVYSDERPRWHVNMGELREIWKFVRYLVINNVIIYLLLKLDDVYLGKVAGLAMLGFYSLSYKVANDSVLYLITTLRKVLLPAFVKVFEEDSKERVEAVVRKSVGTLSGVSWAMVGMVAVSAHEIMMYVAPDPKWRGSEYVLIALMPFVLVRAVNGVYGSLLLVAGRPEVLSRVAGLQLLGLVPLMWLGYELGELVWTGDNLGGVLGVTLAIAVLNQGANLFLMSVSRRLFGVHMGRTLVLMWWWCVLFALGWGGAWYIKQWMDAPLWAEGLIGALMFLAVYASGWQVLGKWAEADGVDRPWGLVRRILGRFL